MTWFWLNIPLAAALWAACTGIPLWLVFKHPDARPAATAASTLQPRPVRAAGQPAAGEVPARGASEDRELVSAGT